MSAVPHLGRLQLRRTAFTRLERIREEHVRHAPAPAVNVRPVGTDIGTAAVNLSKMSPELGRMMMGLMGLSTLLLAYHRDPEQELQRAVNREMRKAFKAEARLEALLERESRIRERAPKTTSLKVARADDERDSRGDSADAHVQRLKRARRELKRLKVVRKYATFLLACETHPVKELPGLLAAAEETEDEMRRVGQKNLSHEKDVTDESASRIPVNAGEPRREGDAANGTTQEHGGGERGRATEASDAPKPSKQRRGTRLHPLVSVALRLQARGPRAVDRIPTPDEHVRPRPRPRRVRRKRE